MRRLTSAAFALTILTAAACDNGPSGPSAPLFQVGASGNFRTIQEAVNAAQSGDVIQVLAGTYAEHVVINKRGIKLQAQNAVLDGLAGGLNGTGVGILVAGVPDVEISGLTVQRFERGIVLQNASNATIRNNEVRNNTFKGSGAATVGVTPFEGIVLFTSGNNELRDNFVHDNGHDGLIITDGSSGNRIVNNRFAANGAQTPSALGAPSG
jgi:pectinesterase